MNDVKAFDAVYFVVVHENGTASVIFSDGKKGARLPSGTADVTAAYREGGGGAGNVSSEQMKGRSFLNKKQAVESLGRRIASDLTEKLSGEQVTYVVYLDVWERHSTGVEDPGLRETAVGGADTSTRKGKPAKRRKKRISALEAGRSLG